MKSRSKLVELGLIFALVALVSHFFLNSPERVEQGPPKPPAKVGQKKAPPTSGEEQAKKRDLHTKAYAKINAEQFLEALEIYHKIRQDFPKDPLALNNSAWCYFKLGRFEEALQDADASLEIIPGDADTLHTKASAFAGLGRKEEALKALEEGLRNNPRHLPSQTLQDELKLKD